MGDNIDDEQPKIVHTQSSTRRSLCVKYIIALLSVTLLPHILAVRQCNATVEGTVLNELGKPVPGAVVSLVEKTTGPVQRGIPKFDADANGLFTIHLQTPGKYLVWADKESDGYAETKMGLFSDSSTQEVVAVCNSTQSVVLRLGPKAATLKHISVTDMITGAPILDATITLRRVSSERLFMTTGTDFAKILVPSNVDVTYQVSAAGYETSPISTINLNPSQEFNIEISLRPTVQKPTQ